MEKMNKSKEESKLLHDDNLIPCNLAINLVI